MIWAILLLLGVPLWLCAMGILALVFRNKSLRQRHGDIPVRVQRAGKSRWTRGHAVWVSDVFAWRGSPAAWSEDLVKVTDAGVGDLQPHDLKKLHRLTDPTVVTLTPDAGEPVRWPSRPNTARRCSVPTAPPSAEPDPATRTAANGKPHGQQNQHVDSPSPASSRVAAHRRSTAPLLVRPVGRFRCRFSSAAADTAAVCAVLIGTFDGEGIHGKGSIRVE